MQDFNQGNALYREGRLEEAAAAYRRAVALRPGHADAHNNLGVVLVDQRKLDEAIASYRRAIALQPDKAKAHHNLGLALQYQGRLDQAAASFRHAIALQPDYAKAYYNLANQDALHDRSPEGEAAFARLERQAADLDRFEPEARSLMLFALGKTLERRGDFDRAFACMAEANAICRAGLSFDIAEAERRMERLAEPFDAALFERLKDAGSPSERPIFIVGMARSGTTLVEQILSAHPNVLGAGEIPNLATLVSNVRGEDGSAYPLWVETLGVADCRAIGQAYVASLPPAAPDEMRTTDKRLLNFEYAGLIHLCLPNARIIHCRRDPRDVALSCFASRFIDGQDYAYDLAELGRYWRAYDRLMDHWRATLPPGRILEAPYEAVVEDVEAWARRLVAHCGLEWNDACLRFHEYDREVYTGSFAQVRRPIYTASIGRWRRFAPHLGPLLEALGTPWDDVRPQQPHHGAS